MVPTLAKNARMGQPQVVVIHGAEAQRWASPLPLVNCQDEITNVTVTVPGEPNAIAFTVMCPV